MRIFNITFLYYTIDTVDTYLKQLQNLVANIIYFNLKFQCWCF